MTRSLTALFAAFEALLVVAIGIGIPLAPLTVLWAAQYGFAPDWAIFWRASADIWLLGHGADFTVTLDAATARASGLAGASAPFAVSLAALGFALLTLLLGVRAGRRIDETRHRLLGELVAIGMFAVLSFAISLSAVHSFVRPSVVQGTILPPLVFALGLFIGTARSRRADPDALMLPVTRWIYGWSKELRMTLSAALRGGAASAAAVITVAAVAVAISILVHYAQIISLYEGLHAQGLGGAAITIAQIALLPDLVVWAVAWLVGPGFAVGTGSMVSPLGTQLGPIPALPVLGALPSGNYSFAFVCLLVPILAGFLAGVLLANSVRPAGTNPRLRSALTGLGMGVVGGLLLGMLAWAATGAAGPGRLVHVGPAPFAVGALAALEIGVGAALGMISGTGLTSGGKPRRDSDNASTVRQGL